MWSLATCRRLFLEMEKTMTADSLFQFVLRWGVTGSLLLAAYLIITWQTGFFGLLRTEPDTARRRAPRASLLAGIGSILMYIVLMVVADMQDLVGDGVEQAFSSLLAYNYTLYIFWLLFDTIFIDILLVTVWHPSLLRLPEPEAHGSVAYHLRTIPRGLVLGMPVTLVATVIVLLIA